MHENVSNLDTILVQCVASVTVNNQLFASLTQEKCALTLNNSVSNHTQVTANSFGNIKVETILEESQNKFDRMIMSHTCNETIVQSKFAGKLSICFFSSNQIPNGVLWKIVQFMWHVKQHAIQVQYTFLIETNNWLLTAIEAIHWSNLISKFGTFSCTEFYLVMFSNFIGFFFGLVYLNLISIRIQYVHKSIQC